MLIPFLNSYFFLTTFISFIFISGVVKLTQVEPTLQGEFIPDGDFKAAKRKISWLAVDDADSSDSSSIPKVTLMEFDNLISKPKLEDDDKLEDCLNPNTLASTTVLGDPLLKTLQQNEIVQLERRGYYRCDRPYISPDKPLILYMVPDGKSKSMGGLTGKLAHR